MHIKGFYRFLLESESTKRVFGDHVEWRNPQGNLHREDGPAVEYTDGTKEWFLDGQRHRLDGPAVEWADGTKAWWVDDQLHRLDGPAVEHADGSKEWWVNGRKQEAGEFYRRRFEQLGDSADLQFLNQLEELVDAGLAQWSTPAIVGELEKRLRK